MNKSKPLSIFAGIVAAVSLLQLAFVLFKEYSSVEIPLELSTAVSMSVSLFSVILFASLCQLFSVDANVRSAGFTLFLSFLLSFFTSALSGLPAAKSNYLIIALLGISPIASYILLIVGLFRMAAIGGESKRFRAASRCLAITELVYVAVLVVSGVVAAVSAMSAGGAEISKEMVTRLGTVFGSIILSIASCWFYWELSRWIRLRWDLHKEDYS